MWSFGIGMIIYYDYDYDYINWLERTHDRSAYSSHAATTELLSYTYLYIHTYIYIYIYIYTYRIRQIFIEQICKIFVHSYSCRLPIIIGLGFVLLNCQYY